MALIDNKDKEEMVRAQGMSSYAIIHSLKLQSTTMRTWVCWW